MRVILFTVATTGVNSHSLPSEKLNFANNDNNANYRDQRWNRRHYENNWVLKSMTQERHAVCANKHKSHSDYCQNGVECRVPFFEHQSHFSVNSIMESITLKTPVTKADEGNGDISTVEEVAPIMHGMCDQSGSEFLLAGPSAHPFGKGTGSCPASR
jgi:hypothetical protein